MNESLYVRNVKFQAVPTGHKHGSIMSKFFVFDFKSLKSVAMPRMPVL